MIGEPLRRKEDGRLLRGQGRYVADVDLPGTLHAAILRSRHARARVGAIEAGGLPPGVGVFTAADLGPFPAIPIRTSATPALQAHLQPPLADGEVRYVGQPVAVVVAPSRYLAEDALERLTVAYEPLPAATDATRAPVADSIVQTRGDVEAAFAGASLVVEERFRTNRHTGMPMETRGVTADWRDGALTVYGVTKLPHAMRALLAEALRLPEERIRVLPVDVGGGFGIRGEPHPEELVVPWLARRLGRPVRWIEDRHEHIQATNHSREMVCDAALALDADGRFLGLKAELWYDGGAYVRTHGIFVPAYTAAQLPGPYRYGAFRLQAHLALTNKTPISTYRGPGAFESCFVRERLIDLAARRLGVDPVELRLRNLVRPTDMPYDCGTSVQGHMGTLTLEPSDYPAHLHEALRAMDYDAWRGRPGVGVGLAVLVKKSADGGWEYARVSVQPDGRVRVDSGSSALGQGVETTLAQICATALGVREDEIDVCHDDTERVPRGLGSFASRTTVVSGNAVHAAALAVRAQALALAADRLEARREDLVLQDGRIAARGAPGRSVALGEVARLAHAGSPAGLTAEHVYRSGGPCYSFSVHGAVVRVDRLTGAVEPLRYFVGHDVGRVVNPLTAQGQFVGGVAQGLGGTCLEELRYDRTTGQLLTGSFADYLVPTAAEMPRVDCLFWEDASTGNPLGVKGAGEAGPPGVAAALANAVADALGDGSPPLTCLPLTPETVWEAGRGS